MPLATVLTPEIAKSAGVAYLHYVSFMVCFAALVVERRLLRPDPDRRSATAMVITDIIMALRPWRFWSAASSEFSTTAREASSIPKIPSSGGRSACI